jgi:glycosyltransferase involved in cell wall biosynthesis
MRATVVLEHRFRRTPNGAVWTDGPFAYSFFERYLRCFDGVRAAARILSAPQPQAGWRRMDGPGVELWPIPYYEGPWEYLRRCRRVMAAARALAACEDPMVLRAPSQAAAHAGAAMLRRGAPFGVEVVGDPYDALAPGAHPSMLRPAARLYHTRALERLCRGAAAAAYVTEAVLQRRYPASPDAFTTSYSSVELPEGAFVDRPRPLDERPLRIVSVGSMEHRYKGFDVLLDAVAELVRGGVEARVELVGDGRLRRELEGQAERLGLCARVCFLGRLPSGSAIRAALDRASMFVLASRQEGLPRVLLEAMARGLPAIASGVGGVGELLPREDLVRPGDAGDLASRLRAAAAQAGRRARAGARNLHRARDFSEEELQPRRDAFYAALRRLAAQ